MKSGARIHVPEEIKKIIAALLDTNQKIRVTAEQAMAILMGSKFSKTKIAAEKEEVKSAEKPKELIMTIIYL